MTAQAFPRCRPLGDRAVTVELGDHVDRDTSARAVDLADALRREPPPGVLDAVPTMAAVVVRYEPGRTSFTALVERLDTVLRARADAAVPGDEPPARLVTLPACYDADLGPDLEELARAAGLDRDAAADLHAAAAYHVHMVGFLPGFAYLSTVPAPLRRPRRAVPRLHVPARSLAVAGELTAAYPTASPGGWHLIGAVPVDLFDIARPSPSLLQAGDRVRFERVDRGELDDLRSRWQRGTWAPTVAPTP